VADAVALAVGGAAWILALSTLSSAYQLSLPQWIKARGMSFYLVVFQGGRRRTGATSWRAWRDAADPARVLEQFVVASWTEHLRQHERVSQRDQARLDKINELADPARPAEVTHWLAAGHPPRSG